jgi:PAS domain S-box-containing protein
MCRQLSDIIFDSISDGVFTVDRNCIITSFNRAAQTITGFEAAQAIGQHCFDVFRTEICHRRCALKDTLKTEDPVDNARVTIITRDGREVPISVTTTLLKDGTGTPVGAVEFFRDVSELEDLRERLELRKTLDTIISADPAIQEIKRLLPDVASSDCSVLMQGASGSGKELFAQVLHTLSPRSYGPYIKLNCAALPAALLESELFGYEKGAFTDAKRSKPGQFALAQGGTLLLDEISEMDVSLQVKLLRVLNDGEFRPLGATTSMHADARIIAATNADLERAISEGRFREDLYYRINVINIRIPPLRERPGDIPLLANHFRKIFQAKTRKPIEAISPAAMTLLYRHSFSGNVRELENAIEHAFVMCGGATIGPEHLPRHIRLTVDVTRPIVSRHPESEMQLILQSLQRNRGNQTRTAAELGMHRTTLWRKLKTHRARA